MHRSPISTFVINLKNRVDRKEHILNEFSNREEFKVTLVEPEKHAISRVSLWNTMKHIVENLTNPEDEFIVICEDDHQFTVNYQKEFLFEYIDIANKLDADILSGGISGVQQFVQVDRDIFWMGYFSGTQFTVIYKRFFKAMLTAVFLDSDTADHKISLISEKKFIIYPFISTQKEFGYSDVTPLNNNTGRVDDFFDRADHTIKFISEVATSYKKLAIEAEAIINGMNYDNFYMPTYIINLPERPDRLAHIKKQFEGKNEFDVHVVEAVKHEKGNLGLWLTIRKIIEQAIINEDDIIILCEDDHLFTAQYSKNKFIKNVIEAHLLGAGVLLGGISKFLNATLVTNELFWVDRSFCTQFTVIYKDLFHRILELPYDDRTHADIAFSAITTNKLITFPFISTQKYLGLSDILPGVFKEGEVDKMFESSQARLSKLMEANQRYAYTPL